MGGIKKQPFPFPCCPINRKCLRMETLKEKKSEYEDESVVHNKSAKKFKTKNPELSTILNNAEN